MWGIVPAAGAGARIQPLAFSKELLPVGSRVDGSRLAGPGSGAAPMDYLPNSTDWFGRWRPVQNPGNDWEIEGTDGGMITAGVGGPITGRGGHPVGGRAAVRLRLVVRRNIPRGRGG